MSSSGVGHGVSVTTTGWLVGAALRDDRFRTAARLDGAGGVTAAVLATSERDDSAVAWLAGDVVRGRVLPDRGRMGGAAVLARGAAGPLSASSNRIGDTAVALVAGGSVGVAAYDLPPSAPTLRDLPDAGRVAACSSAGCPDRTSAAASATACSSTAPGGDDGRHLAARAAAGRAPPDHRGRHRPARAAVRRRPAADRQRAVSSPLFLRLRGRVVELGCAAADGHRQRDARLVLRRGRASATSTARARRALLAAGADIIDVGGESARGDRPAVSAEEEIARVVPLIERLAARGAIVSVDTYKPAVAEAAIAAGAAIVNDVSGLRDPALADVCARTGAALVLMHTRVAPKGTLLDPGHYDDVVADVVGLPARADGGRARARRRPPSS